ncbi:MAG: hypothetical protein Q9168_007746 [Polycauliona sp. 1 TL-2023]
MATAKIPISLDPKPSALEPPHHSPHLNVANIYDSIGYHYLAQAYLDSLHRTLTKQSIKNKNKKSADKNRDPAVIRGIDKWRQEIEGLAALCGIWKEELEDEQTELLVRKLRAGGRGEG